MLSRLAPGDATERCIVPNDPISLPIVEKLIGFDTTSRESNLELIAYIQQYLERFGIESRLVYDDEGRKANLYATVGPADRRGICLSGHTDVVPVDEQPFEVIGWQFKNFVFVP